MIGIINYGSGNIQSVKNALDYNNINSIIIDNSDNLSNCDKIILPGVGSFKFAMDCLDNSGFSKAIKLSLQDKNVKFLGICLGMQLLFEYSEEGENRKGLGIIKGSVKKIKQTKTNPVPNIGWRTIRINEKSTLLNKLPEKPIFYFVHSYGCYANDRSLVKGTIDYNGSIDVLIEKENIFATQFHPEKSQIVGHAILKNFSKL